MMGVYSPGRARQLRALLWAGVVIGAVLAALAVWVLALGGSVRYVLFVGVLAAALLLTSVTTLKQVEARRESARWWAVGTGLVLLMLGLVLAQATIGIVPSIAGILLILLALLPDGGEH